MKQVIKKILIVVGIFSVLGIGVISFLLYAMSDALEEESLETERRLEATK